MFSFAKKLVDRFEGHTTEPSNDLYFKNATQINNRGHALRVLSVIPHSIAHKKGFESWFDYIIKINNHELPMLYPSLSNYSYSINEDGTINYGGSATSEQAAAINYELLAKELSTLAKNKQELILDVWSAKGGVLRQISIELEDYVPSEEEEANGYKLFENNFKQLGLTVESQHLNTSTFVWRILNTHPGSPAFRSQLVPQSDFIIGCDSAIDPNSKGLLSKGGESLLSNTVANYYNYHQNSNGDNVPITLFVYNHDYDILRPVTVNLSRNWGSGHNRGILGCDVGYGILHRIPEVIGKFEQNSIIDDVLFSQDQNHEEEIINQPPPPITTTINEPPAPPSIASVPPPPKSSVNKKKKHVASSAVDGLSDYMNEELEKSKHLDEASLPKTKSESAPPPPPPSSKTS
ncbi:uncharacterized protein KGF55_000549 [Candida pseudojiufengensis]|uniref:uncharacterized protein n=1 Tax=Candida pseudojiufengensis TaxID=497109 RepID=UPI00222514ED|nr:uncharacterized protein KGF55_000549 [Candida pseudojiufengensis]KAI5966240.1 hypothetical protein KGF55_000549 [Candida pseudojiufengensis]